MKTCSVIIFVIFLAVLPTATFAESIPIQSDHIQTALSRASSCIVLNGTLFFLSDDRLYSWDGLDDEAQCLLENVSGILTGEGEYLYLLDLKQGKLERLKKEMNGRFGISECHILEMPKLKAPDGRLKEIYGVVMAREHIFFLTESIDPVLRDILFFSLKDSSWEAFESQNVYAISSWKDGGLLMAQYDYKGIDSSCKITSYDVETRQRKQVLALENIQPELMTYDTQNDSIYLQEKRIIYACSPAKPPFLIASLPEKETAASYSCILNNNYILLQKNGGIKITQIHEDMQPKVLTFAGGVSVGTEDNPAFTDAYPHVAIKCRIDELGTDYAMQLITNTNAADVYLFQTSSKAYQAIISKGYAYSLSQSNILLEKTENLYEFIKEAIFSPEGDLLALPVRNISAPLLYTYNATAWKEANIGPVPTTIDELLDACSAFARRDDLLEKGWRFSLSSENAEVFKRELLQLIIETYLLEHTSEKVISVNTTTFRDILQKFEQTLPAVDYLASMTIPLPSAWYQEEVMPTCLLSYPGLEVLPDNESTYDGACFLPLSLSSENEPVVGCDVTVFVVNASSPNRDLALSYLETYFSNLDPISLIQYVPEEQNPVETDFYQADKSLLNSKKEELTKHLTTVAPEDRIQLNVQLEAVQMELDALEKQRYSISVETIAKYKELTPFMQLVKHNGLNFYSASSKELVSLLNQYIQRSINMERFIEKYDQMIQIIQLESLI